MGGLREAVAGLTPAPRRLEVREEGGIVKILDVANANPRGAAMALEVLGQFSGGSRILITPGMVELGAVETEENRRLGEQAAATRVEDAIRAVIAEGERVTYDIKRSRFGTTEGAVGTQAYADALIERL